MNLAKSKVQKLDLNKFQKKDTSLKKTQKKISQSVQSKEKLVKTIDDLLDFQLKTKQRITSYKKIKEKEEKIAGNENKFVKKNTNPELIQDIPSFLEKTRERLAASSAFTRIVKVEEKKKLKQKMKKLEEIKKKANENISNAPFKQFQPEKPFKLGDDSSEEEDKEDPFEEIQIGKNPEMIENSKKEDNPFNEIKDPEAENGKIEGKLGSNVKNTKTKKKSQHKEKENRAEDSNFKKIDNMVKTINLGKKNVTIDERVKENMKSGKYMNNTQYLILEQEIRKKELEIQEFERKMKQETEKARKNPKEEERLFESLQNFEEEQRIFFHRIHEKIEKDLDHGKKIRMEFNEQKNSEDFDFMEDKTKKIKNFLKSGSVGENLGQTSPFDHLHLINEIIEKNEIKKKKENEKKNEFDLDYFSLDDFEKDIYDFKNLYSKRADENKPKPKNSDFIDLDVQKKLFDDEFLMKPWKFDQKCFK